MRIGHGYDVHRLESGRKLIIGGVDIPYNKGLAGHSDADVLLHSICDALLGAAALGDIGKHFPDNDDKYKGISSMLLLKKTAEIIAEKGFKVVNIDATVIVEEPKLSPYMEEMCSNVSNVLSLERSCVNIKATTEERLGFTGAGEGISAHAVCLIE